MSFWTEEEYLAFSEVMKSKPISYYVFEILYWTGIREGELIALTVGDFNLKKRTLKISKILQRIKGEDVITDPKTEKSNRVIDLPQFLCDEMEDYIGMLYKADTKQWKEMERAHFRKICIKHGLTVDGEIKPPERDSLSVLEYKAETRKREIKKLETQEKELRVTLRNLQRLIKQAEEKLEEAKKEATNIIESAKAKSNEWLEKINLRLGLIPKKDIEDKRRELVGYYKACEPYLTNDMRIAINNEDVKGLGALVSRLTASNPDGTVDRRDPGWEELFDFEIKFGEYLEMKSKNVKTEDIIKELEQPKPERRRNRYYCCDRIQCYNQKYEKE